jgi:hypothetical protein
MKHPVKPCGGRQRDGDKLRGWVTGLEGGAGGGGGLASVSQLVSPATNLWRRDIIGFSAIPWIQIAVSQTLLFSFKFCCQSHLKISSCLLSHHLYFIRLMYK